MEWRDPTADDIGKQLEIQHDRFADPEVNPEGILVAVIGIDGDRLNAKTVNDGYTCQLPFMVR
jgi:hypothetical protein